MITRIEQATDWIIDHPRTCIALFALLVIGLVALLTTQPTCEERGGRSVVSTGVAHDGKVVTVYTCIMPEDR